MSDPSSILPDPSAIGGLSKAPFVLPVEPSRMFERRAERLDLLAQTCELAPYLRFLAALVRVQETLAAERPLPAPIAADLLERARGAAMPPLDRTRLTADEDVAETLDRLFDAAQSIEMPAPATEALRSLREAGADERRQLVGNVVADSIPFEDLARHVFVTAGLQVHAARLAASLDSSGLVPVGTGLCPACGGPPVASVVVGFMGAEGARYGACSFCGTLWNEVRVKCLACGSTKGVGYREVEHEGEEATVKAEVCDECRSWLKILYQNRNPSLEPIADDVASLGLDLLMRDTDYRRAGFDPFLLGY